MYNALIGAVIGAISWCIWSLNYEKRMVPDSYQYAAMARGEKVVSPFWGRWLAPFLLRERGWLWEAMTLVCAVAMHAILAHAYGVRAALLLAPSHLISWNIKAPIQIDFPALTLVTVALVVQHPVALVIVGLYAGAFKQNAPIMAAIAAWSPWPLVGLVSSLFGLRWRRKINPEIDKNPWLLDPIGTTFASKRLVWMNPTIMLFPWGLTLALAISCGDVRLLAAVVVGYLPIFMASDNARLYLWALPVAIGYAVRAPIPDAWWGAILLANAVVGVYAAEVTHYTRGGIRTT